MPSSYTTVAVVREDIPRLASLSDSAIARRIASASSAVDAYCGRSFGPGPFAEIHNANGTGRVWLRNTPVVSVTSVTVNLPGDPVLLDADGFAFDSLTGELRLGGQTGSRFWSVEYPWVLGLEAFQSVSVAYTGEPVPGAIEDVVLGLIAARSAGFAVDPALKAKSMGQVSYTYADGGGSGMSAADAAVLGRFKRYSL